jgi:hypothetical protein
VSILQLDLDIAVLGTNHARIVISHVDAADRHSDVVGQRLDHVGRDNSPDRFFDLGKLLGAFLDAGPDLKTHMHQDLAGINRGKEVPAEERHQQERRRNARQESDDENPPPLQRQLQQRMISSAHALEA